jgi:hypothetical protein
MRQHNDLHGLSAMRKFHDHEKKEGAFHGPRLPWVALQKRFGLTAAIGPEYRLDC